MLINKTQQPLAEDLRRAERSAAVQGSLVVGALALTTVLAIHPAALAQSPGVNLAQLAARVSVLESHASDPGPKGPTGDLGAKGVAGSKGLPGDAGPSGKDGTNGANGKDGTSGKDGAGYTPANLAILGAFSRSGTDLTLSGVNVHIVDGTDGTASTSGLGNLIVGYNGPSSLYQQSRAGSHDLVIGDAENYTSYGGVVCGDDNDAAGPYSSVFGGTQNLARGVQCAIIGGDNNQTSGSCAVVSGGYGNKATGFYAVGLGGNQNTASGEGSVVSGGNFNAAGGLYSSVSGGLSDSAGGDYVSISGGRSLGEGYIYGWKGGNVDEPGYILVPFNGTFGSDKG